MKNSESNQEPKKKSRITISNIKDYFVGNFRYYSDKLVPVDDFIREQIDYRLEKCKDDCVPNNSCIICTCPPNKKVFVTESCNPDRFPDLMNEEDWNKFKEDNDR